eukprot:354954-Chlamydomonas_euryale.AAC.5
MREPRCPNKDHQYYQNTARPGGPPACWRRTRAALPCDSRLHLDHVLKRVEAVVDSARLGVVALVERQQALHHELRRVGFKQRVNKRLRGQRCAEGIVRGGGAALSWAELWVSAGAGRACRGGVVTVATHAQAPAYTPTHLA